MQLNIVTVIPTTLDFSHSLELVIKPGVINGNNMTEPRYHSPAPPNDRCFERHSKPLFRLGFLLTASEFLTRLKEGPTH